MLEAYVVKDTGDLLCLECGRSAHVDIDNVLYVNHGEFCAGCGARCWRHAVATGGNTPANWHNRPLGLEAMSRAVDDDGG